MKRVYQDYLEDILAAIDDVATFTHGYSPETFATDRKTINAVIRSLEIIGEAEVTFWDNPAFVSPS